MNQYLCSLLQRILWGYGTIRSYFDDKFIIVSLLLYAVRLNSKLDITDRSVNRINSNNVDISAVDTVFLSRNVTTSLVDCNIYLH